LDYLAAFFGCLYAKAIAVPLYPSKLKRNLAKISAIAKDGGATVAITHARHLENLEQLCEQAPELKPSTIARMHGHFQILLEGIIANADRRLDELPLLSDRDRHQLLVEWNATQVDYPKNSTIYQLFEAQVEQTPDAVAVVCENQQLTYKELNQKANQLAHYLQKLGVKPEVLVGICTERSLDAIVGLLGILKAGGARIGTGNSAKPNNNAVADCWIISPDGRRTARGFKAGATTASRGRYFISAAIGGTPRYAARDRPSRRATANWRC
jgi:acyl-CoA synthetase (AMP-forming)/AMP-acid ligase II